MSDYKSSEDDFENDELMADNDDIPSITPEQIVTNLFNVLFSDRQYGDNSYWDQRYQENEDEYEWFLSWANVVPYIKKYLRKKMTCLNIGCGNSPMSYQMYDSGYFTSVTSNDISKIVINQMKEKYRENKNLLWDVMSCTSMEYPENTFDFVIDKGTIDALYCASDSDSLISQTLNEVSRVLKPNERYACISFGNRKNRKQLFSLSKTLIIEEVVEMKHTNEFGEEKEHYLYIFINRK